MYFSAIIILGAVNFVLMLTDFINVDYEWWGIKIFTIQKRTKVFQVAALSQVRLGRDSNYV